MINLPGRLKKYGILLPLLLIVVVLVIVNQWTPKEPEAPVLTVNQYTESATILLQDRVEGIYPNTGKDIKSSVINSNLFDGLLNLRNGRLEKGVASDWKNVDDTTWEFTLNPEVRFTNGNNVTAQDVKFSIETAKNNSWPVSVPINLINSVTIVGSDQVRVKTTSPLPNLLILISQIPILSETQYNNKSDKEFPIGTGPFKLISFDNQKDQNSTKDQTIILEKNNNYFGTKVNVKKLIYRYINPTSLAGLNQSDLEKSFQIIESGSISGDLVTKLTNGHYSKTLIPQNQVSVLILNPTSNALKYIQTGSNPFSQAKVRKAISLTLSTSRVIADSGKEARPASQLASPQVFGYNTQIRRIGMNTKLATQLLTESGYPQGFTFTLIAPNDKLLDAKSIAKQLESINLDTRVVTIDSNSEPTRIGNGDFAAYVGSWVNDYYDTTSLFNSALTTGGSENFIHNSNKKLDDQVNLINKTFDLENRERSLQDAMSLAMDDLTWIPLYEKTTTVLVRDTIDLIYSEPFIAGIDISGK